MSSCGSSRFSLKLLDFCEFYTFIQYKPNWKYAGIFLWFYLTLFGGNRLVKSVKFLLFSIIINPIQKCPHITEKYAFLLEIIALIPNVPKKSNS